MGLDRVHRPWFASWEAKVARMTVQVPAIPSGPAIQPCAGVAGEGSQERGQIIATLRPAWNIHGLWLSRRRA